MKPRPTFYAPWRALALLSVSALMLLSRGDVVTLVVVLGIGILWFAATWLLAPYSKVAWRLREPDDQAFERVGALAARLRTLPLVGAIFRLGERLSGHGGEAEAAAYREWLREHRKGWPKD